MSTPDFTTDAQPHPAWCDQCIPADETLPDDRRLHQTILGTVAAFEGKGLEVAMVKFDNQAPTVIVGDVELDAKGIDSLILLLHHARQELYYAGGAQ